MEPWRRAAPNSKSFLIFSGGELELSGDLKDAANRDIEFLRDRPTGQSLRSQTGDIATVCVECRRTAKPHATSFRRRNTVVHPFMDNEKRETKPQSDTVDGSFRRGKVYAFRLRFFQIMSISNNRAARRSPRTWKLNSAQKTARPSIAWMWLVERA